MPPELASRIGVVDGTLDAIEIIEMPFMPGGKQILCSAISGWVCEQCLPASWVVCGSIAMLGLPQNGDLKLTDQPQLIIGGIGVFRTEPAELRKFSGPIISCSFMDKLIPVRSDTHVSLPHGWGYRMAPCPTIDAATALEIIIT